MPPEVQTAQDIIATKYLDECLLNAVAAVNINTINKGDYRSARSSGAPPQPGAQAAAGAGAAVPGPRVATPGRPGPARLQPPLLHPR